MSSRSMGAGMQVIRPPQRGIFPLDHMGECRENMELYIECLQQNKDVHHKCQEYSKLYLQCRMDHSLMSKEDLNSLGYGTTVTDAKEYNREKELAGYVAGKHINRNFNDSTTVIKSSVTESGDDFDKNIISNNKKWWKLW